MNKYNNAGIWQGDVLIKTMLDLGMDEMRKNPWLIDHCFSSLKTIKFVSDKYGQKQIDAAKEWFLNNKIDTYMRPRKDRDQTPFVSVYPGQSSEKMDMKHMGDISVERKLLIPNEIGKPINYVINPFAPVSYDAVTGNVTVPSDVNIASVAPGQILANINNGTGYVILGTAPNTIIIEQGLILNVEQLAVVPEYQYYEARIEHCFNNETYTLGCYAHGDPQNLVWLHSIVLYTILRYRQTLLEGSGFAESYFSSGEFLEDPNMSGPSGEEVYVRFITLTGQVEQTWIKAPQRYIESISAQDPETGSGTIEIISNFNSPPIINSQDPWFTVEDNG